MAKIFVKKHKINEDDAANTQQSTGSQTQTQNTMQNQQTDNAQGQQVTADEVKKNAEVQNLQKQIDALTMTYKEAKKNLEKNYMQKRSQMLAQAAQNGIDTSQIVVGESVNYPVPSLFSMSDLRVSQKLFESKKGESLVKEWQRLLYSAIEGASTSRTPAIEELWTTARIIKNKIYEWESKEWSSEIVPKNHWAEVSEFIKEYLTRSREFSYSKSELDRIVAKLEERVRGSKSFSWIFGRDIDKK